MKNWKIAGLAAFWLAAALLFGGCAMTVEQMYSVPERSERYQNLQVVMEEVMGELEYNAPAAGANQQIVQMADLDGDGNSEIILFAKGGQELPLKILIFTPEGDGYTYVTTIESTGTGFEQVEYAQMDGLPGLELIVGHQVSDQVLRNVSVYSYNGGKPRLLLNTNYLKFLTCDLDANGLCDLFVIQPAQEDGEPGLASLFSMPRGQVERSAEAELSGSAERLKRVITGNLQTGQRAVFVASTAGEEAIITDVFSLVDGVFVNVPHAAEAETRVSTLRNYYVYADDIDMDGVVELPELISLKTPEEGDSASQHMIRWYSLTDQGKAVEKMYTYHNYLEGWYLELDEDHASRIFLQRDSAGGYQFHLWQERSERALLFTIYTMTGEERMNVAQQDDLLVLYKTDNVVYAAKLELAALEYGITIEELTNRFHQIQTDWNTGEM